MHTMAMISAAVTAAASDAQFSRTKSSPCPGAPAAASTPAAALAPPPPLFLRLGFFLEISNPSRKLELQVQHPANYHSHVHAHGGGPRIQEESLCVRSLISPQHSQGMKVGGGGVVGTVGVHVQERFRSPGRAGGGSQLLRFRLPAQGPHNHGGHLIPAHRLIGMESAEGVTAHQTGPEGRRHPVRFISGNTAIRGNIREGLAETFFTSIWSSGNSALCSPTIILANCQRETDSSGRKPPSG